MPQRGLKPLKLQHVKRLLYFYKTQTFRLQKREHNNFVAKAINSKSQTLRVSGFTQRSVNPGKLTQLSEIIDNKKHIHLT